MKKRWKILIALVVYGFMAWLIAMIVSNNGIYPAGSDTLRHLYKGDVLYHAIQQGNWFPLYDPLWYNGAELFRDLSPLSLYVIALCQAVAGGNIFHGYLVLVALLFFGGAMGWFCIGLRYQRGILGAFLGILWFFMPNNLFTLFNEGNLPRALCMVIFPLLLDAVYTYITTDRPKKILEIITWFFLMMLCHTGYTTMIAVGFLVYMGIYSLLNNSLHKSSEVVVGMVVGALLSGIFWVPSLLGGISMPDTLEILQDYFQNGWKSLNPIECYITNSESAYFGLAAFFLAVFGILCSKKKSAMGFVTALIFFFGTTQSVYSIVKELPANQYLWMMWMVPMASGLILYSFLLWDTLRKKIVLVICGLLVLDVFPSYALFGGNGSGADVNARLNAIQKKTLIQEAKEITGQRMALLDASALESQGAYLVSGYENGVAATFGAAWQSASTTSNIVQLNRALQNCNYLYLFDRCKELGNDTVLIQLDQTDNYVSPVDYMDYSAEQCGYKVVDGNKDYRLYHLDVGFDGPWGVATRYDTIGIGDTTNIIALDFPNMEETVSTNLNDYTFEQLSQYDTIYLSGFTFSDRQSAEQMILDLSEAGVKIVVMADGIPEDRQTKARMFLDVYCHDITFSNGYPELDTIDGVLNCDLFPEGNTQWKTVYLDGLDQSYGTIREDDMDIDFYGTVKNDNIIFIGINLSYHYSLTKDEGVGRLLSRALNQDVDELPHRDIVPISITCDKDKITVVSERDHVNTTLADHDIFDKQAVYSMNNLIYVNQGTSVIPMKHPYWWQGLLVSILGLMALIAVVRRVYPNSLKKLMKSAHK